MKKIVKVSFEIEVKRSSKDANEDDLKRDVERMLHVFSRSNGVCVENIIMTTEKRLPKVDRYCRGFGCAMRATCLRFTEWKDASGYLSYFDHCDDETRDGYIRNFDV